MLKKKNSSESRTSKASSGSSSEVRESFRRPKFSLTKAFRSKHTPESTSSAQTLPVEQSATTPTTPPAECSSAPIDIPPALPSSSPPTIPADGGFSTAADSEVTIPLSQEDFADTLLSSSTAAQRVLLKEENCTSKSSTEVSPMEIAGKSPSTSEKYLSVPRKTDLAHKLGNVGRPTETISTVTKQRRKVNFSTVTGGRPSSMNFHKLGDGAAHSVDDLDDTSDYYDDDDDDVTEQSPKSRKGSLPSMTEVGSFDRWNSQVTHKTLPPSQRKLREKESTITVKYVRVHGPEDGAYKNDSKPRGLIFMKNFEKFDDRKYSFRNGSSTDYANLLDLFQQMGYRRSQKYCESGHVTKTKLLADLKGFSKLDHTMYDSCIIILMSHGVKDKTFVCSDGEQVELMDVYSMLNNTNCQHLRNKPKIFIFQFCRPQISLPKARELTSQHRLSLGYTPTEVEFIDLRIRFAIDKMAEQLRTEFRALLAGNPSFSPAIQACSSENLLEHTEGPGFIETSYYPYASSTPSGSPYTQRWSAAAIDGSCSSNPVSAVSKNSSSVFTFDHSSLMTDAAKLETTFEEAPTPDYSDMYSIFSTNSGGIAYRHPRKGSLLVQAICHVFSCHSYQDDIEELVRKVSKWMQQEIAKDDPVASTRHTVVERVNNGLDKAFYFNPTVLKNGKRNTISFW